MIGSARVSSRAADALGGVEAVHAGQHPVQDDETERIRAAGAVVLLEQRKPLLRARDGDRRNRPASEQRLEQFPAGRGVLHDQHRALRRAWTDATRAGTSCCASVAEAGGEEEGRADAGRALEGQVAAHQPRQPPADRQPEPGAAVLA